MTTKNYNVELMQPDELNSLKSLVKEFMERLENIDNELETLKEDRKELLEEFKGKLDMKTLQAVLKVLKIKQGVAHKDTFDVFMEVLTDPAS
jgi:uncharacterized protein (UPF0335 family)